MATTEANFSFPDHAQDTKGLRAKLQAFTGLVLLDRLRSKTLYELLDRATAKQGAFVVQVGAFDGKFDDPLRKHIMKNNPGGILIEPQWDAFNSLSALYAGQPDITCVRTAIAQTRGSIPLYKGMRRSNDPYFRAIASRSAEQTRAGLRHHIGLHMLCGSQVSAEIVPADTLPYVLSSCGVAPEQISVFVCDTEGVDPMVTTQLLHYGARPAVIQYEHLHASPSAVSALNVRLQNMEYSLISTYKDTIAYTP